MHPGWLYWWKLHHSGEHRAYAGCQPGFGTGFPADERHESLWAHRFPGDREDDPGAGSFGVRRPLRFLAHKLRLDETQVGTLAEILSDLKTERAQAEVDRRRSVAAFAEALGAADFDEARAARGANLRVDSAGRLRDAVVAALRRLHALLDDEQRARLAYLIRTGALQI